MSTPVSFAQNNKIGTCPHGLPLGACPICNGMGGGGGPTRAHEKPKTGEMSWEQCYAIGQMMKAHKLAQQQANAQALQNLQIAQMQNLSQQIAAIKNAVINALPPSALKALDGLKSLLLTPISQIGQKLVNALQNAVQNLAEFVNNIKEKLINIADKLTAMMGEMKAAIEKKISEKFKEIKKKIFNLFGLAKVEDEEDEEAKRIEEMNRQEELKKLQDTIFNIQKIKESSEQE